MSTEDLMEHGHLPQNETSWNYNFSYSIKYQIMDLRTVPVLIFSLEDLRFVELKLQGGDNRPVAILTDLPVYTQICM